MQFDLIKNNVAEKIKPVTRDVMKGQRSKFKDQSTSSKKMEVFEKKAK